MSIFEHISVFLSIILGLAVVHLIAGLAQIIDAHTKEKLYWVHLLWVFAMLGIVILVWLGSFVLSPISEFSAFHFLNLLAYAMVTSLMSGLLFPLGSQHIDDYYSHFKANRRRLYFLGILFTIVDGIDGVLEHYNANIPWDLGQYATLSVWMIAFTLGIFNRKEWVDVLIIILLIIGILGWFHSIVDVSVLSW